MDKIIVLPGSADGVFFLNELDYLTKYFDEVIVVSYPFAEEGINRVIRKKNVKLYQVKINIFEMIIKKDLFNWLFNTNTKKEIKDNFSFSRIGFKKLMYILYYGFFYCQAKQYIDKEINNDLNYNIYLYSFWLTRGAYTIGNYNKKNNPGIKKIISRAHGYDLYLERNSMNYLPFRSFIDNNLDQIHFISEDGLQYFINKYKPSNLSSEKTVSKLGTFNSMSTQKIINNKSKICIASCSSIIQVKRLDLIIDVISNINIEVEWIHIGTGNEETKIELYANEKLKHINFKFLGYIDNSQILETYLEYDVDFLINMSDSEGIPVSIMEAISIGIPIIARDVGGIREIVDTNTGLLLEDINNMESVFFQVNEEVKKRIENIDEYKSKHRNCITRWNNKYNADKNYNDFFIELTSK